MLQQFIRQLESREPLSDDQIVAAVEQLTDAAPSVELKADFLTALGKKGETPEEIYGFARQLRQRAVRPKLSAETRARLIVDVCGTGGDRLNTFNISTTASLILAAAGVTVAKHGNRAVTSQAGSADVLEALGIPIELTPDVAAEWLEKHHFAFFFAPLYHPAFKQIGPARKLCSSRGVRTIFNFLGPLLNPAEPNAQLIGVPRPELCEPMARVLQLLGLRRAIVVSGQVGSAYLDEFSTLGANTVVELDHQVGLSKSEKAPNIFPAQPATLADLAGSDSRSNAAIAHRILSGKERGPKRDAVLINAAAGLFIAGHAPTLEQGWNVAGELIDSGRAQAKLEELVTAGTSLRGRLSG